MLSSATGFVFVVRTIGIVFLASGCVNVAVRLVAIIKSLEKTIGGKTVTYDFARLMEGAKEVKCSEFADAMIKNL